MEKIRVKATGMSCSHCENRVKKSLLQLDGVVQCSVNAKTGMVECDVENNKVTLKQVEEGIEDCGFEVVR